jgi:C1A family cysteine protease
MNRKTVTLAIILLMVLGSFGAVGNQISNESDEDCGCNEIDVENIDNVEEKKYYLGQLEGGDPLPPGEEFTGRAPSSWNWRNKDGKDWTTPIKDQGSCGSCYAFGTYAAMEACIKIESNQPDLFIDLSEQYMVSCGEEWVSGILGCDGAYTSGTMEFLEKYGAIPESCFKYVSGGGGYEPPCSNKCSNWEKLREDIDSWGSVSSSQDSIKNALIQYGPLPTSMQVYANFNSYSGGVYQPSGAYEGMHKVAIVGYNDNGGYWICKNSWGDDWGEDGWFKIKYGVCDIEEDTVYIDVQPTADKIKTYYGQQWDEDADGSDYPPQGDWKNYGAHAIRMGESWWPDDASAWYMFDIGADAVKNSMLIGIYFCDWSALPWTGGPDLRVFNWKTSSWKSWGNVGDHDEKKWIWKSLGTSSNDYVKDNGWVWVKIHTEGDDDTILEMIGVQYNPLKPKLEIIGDLDFGTVKGGETVTDTFKVKNSGDSGTELSWEISSWPIWGSWDAIPKSGSGVKAGETVTVNTEVTAPQTSGSYDGYVRVVNKEDSSNFVDVEVKILVKNSRNLNYKALELLQQRFPVFFQILKGFLD